MYSGIPREEIPWYPTINKEKCEGCGVCVSFCMNGVLALEGNPLQAKVIKPYNCVIGCAACAKLCPNEAISFPSREEVVKTLRQLRAKYRK